MLLAGVVFGSKRQKRAKALQSAHPDEPWLWREDWTGGRIASGSGEADIFIYPGFQFQVVGALLTNFHLPKSTLLMLVSAFAGRENVLRAYEHAVKERYRFFSYGDCMFVE